MPFTLSHAAAALPFKRFKPIWPALVVGTFAPDFQYFVLISDEDRTGHRFPYVLTITLPVAVLALWVFERWVKAPLLELMPNGLQSRLQDKKAPLHFSGARQFAGIVLWVAIGILTHIGWDQLTHPLSWLGQHWSLLNIQVPVPFHRPVKFGKLLQFGSSAFGVAVIAVWVALWYRRAPVQPRTQFRPYSYGLRMGVLLGMTVIALLVGYSLAEWRLLERFEPVGTLYYLATLVEAVILVFTLQILLYGLTMSLTPRMRRAR